MIILFTVFHFIVERIIASHCESCKTVKTEITLLKGKITRLKKKLVNNQEQWVESFKEIQQRQLPVADTGKVENSQF